MRILSQVFKDLGTKEVSVSQLSSCHHI